MQENYGGDIQSENGYIDIIEHPQQTGYVNIDA